jgi:hypothetical protein
MGTSIRGANVFIGQALCHGLASIWMTRRYRYVFRRIERGWPHFLANSETETHVARSLLSLTHGGRYTEGSGAPGVQTRLEIWMALWGRWKLSYVDQVLEEIL